MAASPLPGPVRELGALLFVQIGDLDEKIAELERGLRECAVPRIALSPGCIRVIGLPRRAHTDGIGSEAPQLQSDPRLSCRDPLNEYARRMCYDSSRLNRTVFISEIYFDSNHV